MGTRNLSQMWRANDIALVLWRVMQAIGASMVTAVGPAYVARYVVEKKRGMGTAFVTGAGVLRLVLGPPAGLLITNVTSCSGSFS